MASPVCSCGHLVVDDQRCACIGWCPTCASEDCCAETWAAYEHQLTPSADLPACRDEDPATPATRRAEVDLDD